MAAAAALLKLCCIDQGRFKQKFCWAHLQSEDWVSCSTAVAAANWEMDTSPQSRSRQPEHEQGHTMVAEAVPKLGIYIQHHNRNKCTVSVCQRISKYSFIRSTNTFSLIKVPTKSAFALTNLLRHIQMGVSNWSSQLKLRSVPAKILIDDWFNMYRQ